MNISNTLQNNDKQNNSRKVLGISAGMAVGLCPLPVLLRDKITALSDKALLKKQEKLLQQAACMDSFEKIKKYADEIILKTGLKNRGLEIQNKRSSNLLRARFSPESNIILINDKSLYTSVFKEIGHALNFHNSKLTKSLLKMKKVCSKIVPIIGISGLVVKLLHNKKEVKNKPMLENIKDFFSDNAAAILCLTYVPILIEEGIASKKALKLAEPYLTKAQQQKHIKLLLLSFCSCLMIPIMFASATNLGVFVKNKIINSKKPD